MLGYIKYELQTYANGVWKIDSVYDDRKIAFYEAQCLQQGGRYSAIRIVEERLNHRSGNYFSKTVFRAAKTDAANAETLERRKIVRQGLQETRPAAGSRNVAESAADRPRLPQRSGPGPVALTLLFGVIVLTGIGCIITLRHLFGVI